MDPLAIIALVFGVCALAPLTVTLVMVRRTRRRLAGTVRLTGTIIGIRGDVETRRNNDGGTFTVHVRYPRVVYTDPSTEQERTFESRVSTSLPVGATLPVAVRPGSPATAFVNTFAALWVGPLVVGVLAAGFAVAAVGLALGAALR